MSSGLLPAAGTPVEVRVTLPLYDWPGARFPAAVWFSVMVIVVEAEVVGLLCETVSHGTLLEAAKGSAVPPVPLTVNCCCCGPGLVPSWNVKGCTEPIVVNSGALLTVSETFTTCGSFPAADEEMVNVPV